MEERTGWRKQNESQIGEEKWQTCWCCRDQQRACRMAQASAEKLEHTGPAETERVASVLQREQLTSTPEPPLPKGKGTEYQITRGDSQSGREPHLGERKHEKERVDSTVNEGRFQGGKRGQGESRRKHERVSGRKSSPGRSAESWFHFKSGQT